MNANNPFKSHRIEFHILQSFPVSCLNRDDVGAPKTAVIGGTTRARVSSQCWKRQVRLAMHDLGVILGTRTKLIGDLIAEACIKQGATEEQANACGSKIEHIFIKGKDDKSSKKPSASDISDIDEDAETIKTDTLLFLSPHEVAALAK